MKVIHRHRAVVAVLPALFLVAAQAPDREPVLPPSVAPPVPRPTGPVDSCVTTECHTKIVAGRVLHGPTAQKQCDACHVVTDLPKHKYRLIVGKNDLCGYCHTRSERTVVHKPVSDGDCTGCHDPHGSDRRLQLLGDPSGLLCFPCHKPEEYGGVRFTAGGMEVTGNCSVCHESHSSWMPRLLPREVQELCLFCHEKLRGRMELLGRAHKPVMDGRCLDCHDAHTTGHPGQLRDAPPQLCYLCHEHDEFRMRVETSPVVHGAMTTVESCNGCHAGHGSALPKLLAQPEKGMCLACHDEPLKTQDDRVVPDLAQQLKESPRHHGPVREGRCSPCHDSHASVHFALLLKAYPKSFYAAFEVDAYALCFECHIEELVTSEKGIGSSEFRDKERNLHFVHVNKPFRGRTCRACHEVHASSRPFHMREAVPFGPLGWGIEVNYTSRPTGGSCSPGCHEARYYDRGEGEMPRAPQAGLKPKELERFLQSGS